MTPDLQIVVVDSTATLMTAVFALRHEVFVVEQAVAPELERDEFDAGAMHLVALRGDAVIGTLRIVRNGASARIGRMAVRAAERKQGVGSRLMQTAEAVAAQTGVKGVVLHAQRTAEAFYCRLGYRAEGETFEEAGMPHVTMHKSLA